MSKGTINKVIIVGNLGRDPELRSFDGGGSVVNISVATTDSWKDKSGAAQEKTEWHRVSFFGKAAEVIAQYARKGSKLYIEGSLQTRKYTDKDGVEKYVTEVKGREFTFIGGKDSDAGGGGGARTGNAAPIDETGFGDMEDIPF